MYYYIVSPIKEILIIVNDNVAPMTLKCTDECFETIMMNNIYLEETNISFNKQYIDKYCITCCEYKIYKISDSKNSKLYSEIPKMYCNKRCTNIHKKSLIPSKCLK